MISTKKTETVSIVLDGEEVDVPAGINLVDAAALFKKEIPHYCYHPQLSVAGNCRMCLIEMGTPMRDRGTGEAIRITHATSLEDTQRSRDDEPKG